MGRPLAVQHEIPSQEILLEVFDYSSETGELTWKMREAPSFAKTPGRTADWHSNQWNSKYGGKPAGGFTGGYFRVYFEGKHHMAHRLIWKLMTGEDPVQVDHIDGDRRNNRFSNLRNVTHAINMKNKSLYANNKTGIPGVEYHERDKVWRAKIGVDGGQVQLGSYPTKHEATIARIAGQIMLDYHENHGRAKTS